MKTKESLPTVPKTLGIGSIIVCILLSFLTESALGQNLKREVIFTLNENEVIHRYGEYRLLHAFNQDSFVCLIRDTIAKKTALIHDGNREQEISNFNFNKSSYSFRISNNSFLFTYPENGKYYINYNGVVCGGFDKIKFNDHPLGAIDLYNTDSSNVYFFDNYRSYNNSFYYHDRYYNLETQEEDYDYLYKLENKWYACKNGENKTINFFDRYHENGKVYQNINGDVSEIQAEYFDYGDEGLNVKLTENDSIYSENGKYYIIINGEKSGGFDLIIYEKDHSVFAFLDSGIYAYTYENQGKYYININGNVSESFDYINNVRLTKSGNYAYTFYKDNKYFVNVNGKINEGGNQMISLFKLTENGSYAYGYHKYADKGGEAGKKHINVNGEIVGDLKDKDIIYNLYLTDSGNYAYTFRENEGNQDFVNVNGIINKASYRYNRLSYERGHGHDYLYSKIILTESGNYAYTYKHSFQYEKFQSFININGKIDSGFEAIAYYNINENGYYAYCYVDENENDGYDDPYPKNRCVNINGNTNCGFDYLADFVLVDNGDYSYRFGKNGKHYVNTNGEIKEDNSIFLDWRSFRNRRNNSKLETTDRKHYFHYSHEHRTVDIDGKAFDNMLTVQSWYDENKNAFIWTSVEDKEIVVYEYKLH